MRKRFKKRLLGIILTILMVVSVIPVQQVQPVKAAAGDTIPAGTTIYLRPNAATTWIKDNAVMAFKTSANNKQSEIVVMTKMDDCLTWYGTTTAAATNIDFLRLNPNDTNQVWNEAGTWPGLESGKNLYTFALHTGVTPTGMWTTYSNTGSETTSYFNVNATLVDYFNNGRVEQPKNTLYNEGNMTGEKNAPYAKLNQWLSNLPGYALNGVDSTDNVNAPVPLYFGDLLHTSQAGGNGNLSWYWKGANVAFGPNKETASKDVAQGIVGKNLDDGNLITSYTNENGDPVKVPFFNEDAYPNQSKYMRFYNNLQFPFTKTTNDKGVSTYSFDSAKNTVYYDYDNKKIVRKDDLKIHDASKDNSIGYFPFNSTDPDQSAKDNLNYGFGTQFTIPFTVTETGKNVDGSEMEFNFTGDDDVWVYIDGALVLDMGGAHNKAEGKINFAKQEATIRTGTSNAKLGNSLTVGGRTPAEPNGNTTVKFENIMVKKSGSEPVTLDKYMKKSGTVHELKMYYMERGMWNSNMSISYSFVPLPSGLTLSKTLDTTDVNAGLKNAVQGLDNFDFKIQKKNLKTDEANYSDVENLGYTLYDYDDRTFPGQEAKDSTATFSSSYFASDFINTKDKNNSSAFYAGTGFQITESIPQGTKLQYDTSKTRWGVYDSITSRAAIEGGKGAVATFNMGDDTSSEMDVVNRYVNFVNTPKVGSLSVAKKYEGYAPENETFGFTVLVDLTGHDYYDSYKLEYTGTQNGTTDENGHFTLKVGDTVTFAGIPAGATYKVVEDAPGADDTWVQDTAKCTKLTGTIVANTTSAAVVTNKTKTTVKDYVIYAEAGKTVTYAPDGVTITDLTAPITGDKDITTNVNKDGKGEFTPTSSNKKYDVNYEGTTTDKGNFAGKITVLTYEATNKVYVFDYGLESNIADTTTGDGLFQGGIFYNEKATGTMATTAKLGEITPAQENSQTTISGSNIEIDKDGKAASAVTFKPIAFMDKAENYKYTANIAKVSTELDDTNPETGTTVHGTIKTMPANVVYYEDNFNASNNTDDSSVKIVYTNSKPTNDPTYSQSNDQSENYGHDKAYNGDLEESGNSATEMNNGDGAYFTFTGDGFDIVSRTNENTAGLIAYVYNGKKDAEYFRNPEVFKAGTKDLVKSIPVDTFYSNGDLYQVPVISTTLQQRGTYTVYLKALKTYTGQSVIYIDGVRIYNPLADKSAYLETEKNTKVQELRGMLLGSSPSINLVTPDGNNGFLIDGGSTAVEQYLPEKPEIGAYLGAETLADVMKAGPNNELYLPIDNGVAFKVSTPVGDADWTLQVGAKSVSADTSTESDAVVADKAFTVYVKPDDVKETKYQEVKNYTINTSTDMYYDINLKEVIKAQGWTADSYDVIVLNTTVDYNYYDIISLTNIKCAADMTLSKPSQLTRMGYNLAGRNVLTGNDEAVLSAKFGVTNVTRGKYASMTVVTKKEATDVQVTDPTGAVVTSFTKKTSSIDADGNKEWKLTFKVIKQRGEAKYSVDAVVNGSLTNMPYSTSIMVR
ncbi:MAG: fibro-slime domain-containing protein [Agathobacter sp.]